MKIVIDIPEEYYERLQAMDEMGGLNNPYLIAIVNGTSLSDILSELQRELFMSVDGGTDDRYVRYVDVCDRIEKTIKEFVEGKA